MNYGNMQSAGIAGCIGMFWVPERPSDKADYSGIAVSDFAGV